MSVLFALEGRTNRSTRWLQGMLPLLSITFFLIFVFGPLNEEITSLLIPLVVPVAWFLTLALSVEPWGDWNRIGHDRNQNRARPEPESGMTGIGIWQMTGNRIWHKWNQVRLKGNRA